MIEIRTEIKGLDTLMNGLKVAPEKTIELLSQGIKESIRYIQSDAIKEAPANKGKTTGDTLRQNIKSKLFNKLKGAVVADRFYAIFVHEGTAPHEIRPRIKKGLANTREGQYFGKLVRHPGTRPNPFMQRAYDKNKSRINQIFNRVVDDVIKIITK